MRFSCCTDSFTANRDSRAILFNVKGDDLLYLDRPNAHLSDGQRELYKQLGLRCEPFRQVAYHGVSRPLWTLREFAERDLLRHILADTDQTGVLEFALDRVVENLRDAAGTSEGPGLMVEGEPLPDLPALVEFLAKAANDSKSPWFENVATGTRRALCGA